MTSGPSVAGAVLTGGSSRRMGRDKALVEVDGEPMARRAVRALQAAGADPVLLVGGDPVSLGPLGVQVIDDRWPGEGPLGGVGTALLATAVTGADIVVVSATDQPWLEPEDLRSLIAALTEHPEAVGAVADRGQGRFDGLPGAWRRSLGPAVAAAVESGERRLDHLRMLGPVRIVPAREPDALADVDEPDDLRRDPP